MIDPRIIIDDYPEPSLAHFLYQWIADNRERWPKTNSMMIIRRWPYDKKDTWEIYISDTKYRKQISIQANGTKIKISSYHYFYEPLPPVEIDFSNPNALERFHKTLSKLLGYKWRKSRLP
jgi:hypothetical protein